MKSLLEAFQINSFLIFQKAINSFIHSIFKSNEINPKSVLFIYLIVTKLQKNLKLIETFRGFDLLFTIHTYTT
jgi:hypothetical protein